ncbi:MULTISPECIES: hypothetical protein [Ensifer]|uniref:hypothetical protein n=1 Tax=Ensifer sp. ENS11 TaxID=2769291 RepID=UPI0004B3F43E|nr:hypothetical protein [Ensifer sp. ENS11]MDP9634711.1 hypothetical protein [Ensifer adhaerens]
MAAKRHKAEEIVWKLCQVCTVLERRSTQRKVAKTADDEAALTASITALAHKYGRYGFRPIKANAAPRRAGLLTSSGLGGLKVPAGLRYVVDDIYRCQSLMHRSSICF